MKNRALDFLNSIILQLQYEKILSSIFEEARASVDKELSWISRPVLEKLVETYQRLQAKLTPLEYSQVAFACREILQDFTDAIFKDEYFRQHEAKPTHEQTKNKLWYALRQKLEREKDTEVDLLSAQIDYLNAYFDKLTTYIQKETHADGFEPTVDDAKRCIAYTYLIMWDDIRFLKHG